MLANDVVDFLGPLLGLCERGKEAFFELELLSLAVLGEVFQVDLIAQRRSPACRPVLLELVSGLFPRLY